MRWDSLIADSCDPVRPPLASSQPLPLQLPTATVRAFDTPGFAGLTFHEVRARSIINRVPDAARVPFRWTVNPYRGCSHACTYCLAGDTPVLLADGGTARIADLTVGAEIIGTAGRPGQRRFTVTRVLDHWTTIRPAFRVLLDDGTVLVASRDHRLLSDRGWVHVATGADALMAGDRLIGVGEDGAALGSPPQGWRLVVGIEPTGRRLPLFDITTGTGDFVAASVISHNCFARQTHTYLDLDAGLDFDSQIIVKVNATQLLRRELAAPSWAGERIAMGTNVDCYQRAEGRYRLMRGILQALIERANPFSILTKGTLISRDLDLLTAAAASTDVGISFSIGFLDEALWRQVEAGAPSPRSRLDTVRRFSDAGFAVTVLLAPILPGLTDSDESIDVTVAALASAGAVEVVPLPLHLRPGAREWYFGWLSRHHPELVARYRDLFESGWYAPKQYQRELVARVAASARRNGLSRPRASHPPPRGEPPQPSPQRSPAQLQPTLL